MFARSYLTVEWQSQFTKDIRVHCSETGRTLVRDNVVTLTNPCHVNFSSCQCVVRTYDVANYGLRSPGDWVE